MAKATQRPGSLNLQGFKRFVETKVQPDLRPIAIKFWQPAAREASELTPACAVERRNIFPCRYGA